VSGSGSSAVAEAMADEEQPQLAGCLFLKFVYTSSRLVFLSGNLLFTASRMKFNISKN